MRSHCLSRCVYTKSSLILLYKYILKITSVRRVVLLNLLFSNDRMKETHIARMYQEIQHKECVLNV